jgi:fucose permease
VFIVFAVYEARRQRRGNQPLVRVGLFRQRALTGGVSAQLALYAAVTGFFFVLLLTLQAGFGYTALHAGLTFLPFSFGVAATSGASGGLAPRLGRRLTITGVLVMAAGMAILFAAVHVTTSPPGSWILVPGLLVAGAGMGLDD